MSSRWVRGRLRTSGRREIHGRSIAIPEAPLRDQVRRCLPTCYGALGTDTGGSVRFPATFCSVVGLKVTYGLVPIRGIMPLTLSLDSCGPMARTVEDTAILLNYMTGYDNSDITSVRHESEDYVAAIKQPVSAFRVGMPYGCYDRLDPEVRANVMRDRKS